MVFEHMDSNLEHVLKQHQMFRKAIEEPLLKSYIHQALVGTQEMHSRGICHRDLKPYTFLLT
jgi:serine/threonine protein kinase